MTKEELSKEAEEKFKVNNEDKDREHYYDRMWFKTGYLAGAEPREKLMEMREKETQILFSRLADRGRRIQIFEKRIADLGKENKLLGERCNQLLKDKGELTDKIADIKANCDLAIEGRDIKIDELEEQNSQMFNTIALQEQQIEKMKKRKVFLLQIVDADDYTIDRQFYTTDEEIAKEWDKYDKYNYCYGQAIELEEISDKERIREELND